MITKEQLIDFHKNCLELSKIQYNNSFPDYIAIEEDGSVYIVKESFGESPSKYELDFDMIYVDKTVLLKIKEEEDKKKKEIADAENLKYEQERDMRELKRWMDKYRIPK